VIKRYYNGVAAPRTTICCSALALTTVVIIGATGPASPVIPALFPLRPVWTLALTSSLAVPPAFHGSRGYFPIDGDGFAAYDLDTGEQVWRTSARPQSKPAAGEGLVFIADTEALAALRDTDGSEAWRFPLVERLAAPLVWDNGWLIAATESGTLLALRGLDGNPVWRRDLGSPLSAPPALAADRVYAPARDGRIVALRVDTGEPIWERRLGGAPSGMLALDDRLYVGSDDNFFYCLTARNGQIDWRWRTGGDVVGTPVVDERRVYFVSFDNILRALDRRSGAQRWKRPLPLRPLTGAVMAGEIVIVSGVAPPLRAFQTKDGAPAGEVAVEGELAAPAYVLSGPRLPLLVVVARDIAKGTTVNVFARAFEPPILPIAPLPNIVPMAPPAKPGEAPAATPPVP
jgi:outer membrane protein assembly factor BamB